MEQHSAEIVILVYLALIIAIGFTGNLLALRVYLRKAYKSGTFVLISFMAASDLIICLMATLGGGYFVLIASSTNKLTVFCKVIFILNSTCILLSLITGSVVAFERYMAVCRPHNRRLTIRTALILSICCFFLSFIFSIPMYFLAESSIYNNYDSFVVCKPNFDEKFFKLIPQLITFSIVVLSLTFTSVCYTLVLKAMRNHGQVGSSVGTADSCTKKDDSSGKMKKTYTFVQGEGQLHSHLDGTALGTGKLRIPPDDRSKTTSDRTSSSVFLPNAFLQDNGARNDNSDFVATDRQLENLQEQFGGLQERTPDYHDVDKTLVADKLQAVTTSKLKTSHMKMVVQRKITLMLFATAVISVVTLIPMVITSMIPLSLFVRVEETSQILFHFLFLCQVTGFVNNAANPFIYGLFDKNFRKECVDMTKCKRK